ncbi:MAG: outer membrane beta-barrel protein [Hyphomicrobium sp.]
MVAAAPWAAEMKRTGLLAATLAALPFAPALALDTHPDANLITDTVASADRRRVYDDAAKHGAGTVDGHQRGPGEAEGLRFGNFFVFPEVKTKAIFDDNIFRSDIEKQSDLRFEVLPSVRVLSSLPRHVMDFSLYAKTVSLVEHDDQNYADVGASFSGALHFDHAHTLSLNVLSEYEHQEKGLALTPRDAKTPVPIFHNRAAVGLTRDVGRLYGTVSVSADRLDYVDVDNIDDQPLDQDYRDTDIFSAQLRAGYRFSPGFDVVAKLKAIRQLNEGNAIESSQSTGYEATAGLQLQSNPLLKWHLLGGYGVRDFDRAEMDPVHSALIEGGVEWLPLERLTFRGTVSREISAESTDDGIGTIETSISAKVDYDIFNNLVAHAGVSVSNAEFLSSEREDTLYGAHVSLDYFISKNWQLTLGYDYEFRESNVDINDMSRNRFTVGAKLKF